MGWSATDIGRWQESSISGTMSPVSVAVLYWCTVYSVSLSVRFLNYSAFQGWTSPDPT